MTAMNYFVLFSSAKQDFIGKIYNSEIDVRKN